MSQALFNFSTWIHLNSTWQINYIQLEPPKKMKGGEMSLNLGVTENDSSSEFSRLQFRFVIEFPFFSLTGYREAAEFCSSN